MSRDCAASDHDSNPDRAEEGVEGQPDGHITLATSVRKHLSGISPKQLDEEGDDTLTYPTDGVATWETARH